MCNPGQECIKQVSSKSFSNKLVSKLSHFKYLGTDQDQKLVENCRQIRSNLFNQIKIQYVPCLNTYAKKHNRFLSSRDDYILFQSELTFSFLILNPPAISQMSIHSFLIRSEMSAHIKRSRCLFFNEIPKISSEFLQFPNAVSTYLLFPRFNLLEWQRLICFMWFVEFNVPVNNMLVYLQRY